MSPVHKLTAMGSLSTNKVDYPSMLAGYGDFGAMQRIAYYTATGSNFCTFSNIPQTFQDLMVVVHARGTNTSNTFGTASWLGAYANGDPTSCSATYLRGDGSSATSTRTTGQGYFVNAVIPNANATSGVFGGTVMHILNYANTTTHKTILARSAFDMNGSGQTWLTATLYAKTPGISSLTIYDISAGNNAFAAGTTVALYGVRASAA